MAAAADEKARQTEEASSSCSLYRCFCCWRRACSPRIPRVAPGTDYLCVPAGADDSPAWSVLVGLLSGTCAVTSYDDSVLGLHRFRVARSGRILGRSDDALDILHTVPTAEGCSRIISAAAALAPDGRSLCLFSEHLDPGKVTAIPRAHQLRLTYNSPSDRPKNTRSTVTASALPRLPPERPMRCRPVSAAGRLWAPNIELDLLNGCAVLHDDTILVSLRTDRGMLTFSCSDSTWTEVTTIKDQAAKETHTLHTPIQGVDQEDQRRKLKLEPPVMIDSVSALSAKKAMASSRTWAADSCAPKYEDKYAIQTSMLDYPVSSYVVDESSQMLDCCSNFLSDLGYYKFEEPPEEPALQINKELYIICQAWSQLIVQDDIHVYSLMEESKLVQFDGKIIAVSDTLQVLYHDQSKWIDAGDF
ncbi:uncharacterized protein [Lolium perenne]|uniref:uncharacterized protein n=1 Tax=Lolium perenne TaxID=4522 RepID=UPI003A9A1070